MGIVMIGKGQKPTLQMCTDYCDTAWRNPGEIITQAKATLKGVKFDTFVATGMSGALAIGPLARAMRKNVFIVRKDADHQSSHSSLKWLGQLGARWVFLDDFVSSGSTRNTVIKGVQEALDYGRNCGEDEFTTEFVGTYEYEWDRWTEDGTWDSNAETFTAGARLMKPTPREPEPTYGELAAKAVAGTVELQVRIDKGALNNYLADIAPEPRSEPILPSRLELAALREQVTAPSRKPLCSDPKCWCNA